MCGITGVYVTSDAPGEAGVSLSGQGMEVCGRLVNEHLLHRGPDDQGLSQRREGAREVTLGHTRLAILDLSPAGHQPMLDPQTGNQITYNGEIYNFQELRRALGSGPESWRSHTDTEVILRAYSRWGKDCLQHLRGMFAFAIWDAGQQTLFLARDRLGIKPLYYYQGDNFFAFASEVRALLASGLVPRHVDPNALWDYLAYQSVPAPRTMIQRVRSLPPGCWMTVAANGQVSEGRYWDLLAQASPEARFATEAESRRRIGELLREAVALHLVSDVPVGVFLSGGIDSSAIVALMHEVGHTPQTFSVVFAEEAFNEAQYARQVAARFHAEHVELPLTQQSLLDQLPEALRAMDQPTGDGVNTYVVSKAVRSAGIKVAMSGLGGDEFFAGYPSFTKLANVASGLRLWRYMPASARSAAAKAVKAFGGPSVSVAKVAAMIESCGTLAELFPLMRQVLSFPQRRALINEPWLRLVQGTPDPYVRLLQDAFAGANGAGYLARVSYAEGRTYMHDVLLRDADQMSMAHSLEVRVPLLDHKLVEYLMGVPDAYKRPDGVPKRLLVKSLGGLLPDEIVHRPKKGFTLPFALWMRGAMRRFCEERLDPDRIAARGMLRPEQVQRLWQAFLEGRSEVSWSRLWVLVVLEDWLERNQVSM